MKQEIRVITQMGYVDYFLIVWDYIRFARSAGIPVGPGRGSGAGSICAYCMEITQVDPLQYHLLFERFLNPERVSMPDFDIDFCIEGRQRVKEYVVEKYGADHVSEIITFDLMKARGLFGILAVPWGFPTACAIKSQSQSIPAAPFLRRCSGVTAQICESCMKPMPLPKSFWTWRCGWKACRGMLLPMRLVC